MLIEGSGRSVATARTSPPPYNPPDVIARNIVAQNTTARGIDPSGAQRDVAALRQYQPELARSVEQHILATLSPFQQGQYLRANDNAATSPFLSTMLTAPVPANANQLTPQSASAPAGSDSDGPGTATLVADIAQMTLDLTGIVEPTPFSDGANTVISVGRSLNSLFRGNFSDAGGHFVNGVLSAAGMIPYLGDLAKAGKFGKWAQTVSDIMSAVARNPALLSRFEPLMRKAGELLDKIPASVLDKLPSGARESIERMKTQIGEFSNLVRFGRMSLDELASGLARSSGPEAAQFANEMARRSTNGAGDRVVLGRYPGYINEAQANGGVYFSTPEDFFDTLRSHAGSAADDKMWQVNEAFLRQQLDNGITRIDFTPEGLQHALDNPTSFSARELEFLTNNAGSYGFERVGTSFVRN